MTIMKNVFISAAIAVGVMGGFAQASSLAGFDYSLLTSVVEKSQEAVDAVETSLNVTKSVCTDIKSFAKNLYTQQKNALKLIKAELKRAYKTARLNGKLTWFTEKQLYKAYKKLVYKYWKKTRRFPTF